MINKPLQSLSLYLHIPFCVKKCHYCDFLSAPGSEEIKEQYVKALIQEITQKADNYKNFYVDTIFFGGGTPSILSLHLMAAILKALRESFRILPEAEISIEVNPGTADEDKLMGYRQLGINRLSIGLQSANDVELKAIGRIHTYLEFQKVYEQARKVGFSNINVDLMSALPGQTLRSYQDTIHKILQLQPEHISAYSLIIEEGTPFWEIYGKGVEEGNALSALVRLPEENTEREMYRLTKKLLEQAGYVRYEISNYAKPGFECRHNTGYWQRHNYLGLGLGSSSLIENCRWKNETALRSYLKMQDTRTEIEVLSKEEQMEEFMFLGLRLTKGVSKRTFTELFGMQIEAVYGEILQKLTKEKLLVQSESDYVRLTERGIDISNTVMAEFLFD